MSHCYQRNYLWPLVKYSDWAWRITFFFWCSNKFFLSGFTLILLKWRLWIVRVEYAPVIPPGNWPGKWIESNDARRWLCGVATDCVASGDWRSWLNLSWNWKSLHVHWFKSTVDGTDAGEFESFWVFLKFFTFIMTDKLLGTNQLKSFLLASFTNIIW